MKPEERIEAVREFSRIYRQSFVRRDPSMDEIEMGPLELQVFMTLAASPDGISGPRLAEEMRLHKSQVSRFIESFRQREYITSEPAEFDRRILIHRLTPFGRDAHRATRRDAAEGIVKTLLRMSEPAQERLVHALATAGALLRASQPDAWRGALDLREARAGDYAWVIERHATIYRDEHGYDETFEGFVAEGVGQFAMRHESGRERAFIAGSGGQRAGSAFVVKESARVARLRFFLVEPAARGQGIGSALLRYVLQFARQAQYDRMVLGTHAHLKAAISLYRSHGFQRVREEPHRGFGRPIRAQEWALDLKAPAK